MSEIVVIIMEIIHAIKSNHCHLINLTIFSVSNKKGLVKFARKRYLA